MDEYIDKKALIEGMVKVDGRKWSTKTLGEVLDAVGSIEIVRCKDCRHAVNEPDRDGSDVWICNYNQWRRAEGIRYPGGFCSEGDRREKENV